MISFPHCNILDNRPVFDFFLFYSPALFFMDSLHLTFCFLHIVIYIFAILILEQKENKASGWVIPHFTNLYALFIEYSLVYPHIEILWSQSPLIDEAHSFNGLLNLCHCCPVDGHLDCIALALNQK